MKLQTTLILALLTLALSSVDATVPQSTINMFAPVAPDVINHATTYEGLSEVVIFTPEYYAADPRHAIQAYQWEYSTDGGSTWTDPTVIGGYVAPNFQLTLNINGTLEARCRAVNPQYPSVAVSSWVTSPNLSYVPFLQSVQTNTVNHAASPYTVQPSDANLFVDTSGGAVTITLPAANAITGRQIGVVKTTSDANAVTITADGSDTILGSATYTLSKQYGWVTLVSDGAATWEWAARTWGSEAANQVLRTGSGGIPTIGALVTNDLPSTAITPATYGDATHAPQVTFDQKGRATGAASVAITGLAESDIVSLVSDLSGKATWAGDINGGSASVPLVTGLYGIPLSAAPGSFSRSNYVYDSVSNQWQLEMASVMPRCRAVATTNITPLSGLTTVTGGITNNIAGKGILLSGQTTGSENGPWLIQAGAWTRPAGYSTGAIVSEGTFLLITEGTYGNTLWYGVATSSPSTSYTVGTNASTWTMIAGGGAGGGTVSSGTAGQIAYYSGTGTTVGGENQVTTGQGGTGQDFSASAQGGIPYLSAAGVFSVLPKNTTATRYLSNTGTSNNPAWAQIDVSNGITGLVPLANGGTNVDLSASGGTSFVLKENGSHVISAAALTATDVTQNFRRNFSVSFNEPTATGIDTAVMGFVPYVENHTSMTWTPTSAQIYCASPVAGHTTAQLIKSTVGNATFGSGTNLTSASLDISGASTYSTTTTSMSSTVASGDFVAVNWTAVGGSNCSVEIEFESATE